MHMFRGLCVPNSIKVARERADEVDAPAEACALRQHRRRRLARAASRQHRRARLYRKLAHCAIAAVGWHISISECTAERPRREMAKAYGFISRRARFTYMTMIA
jgi:hypothetical protein